MSPAFTACTSDGANDVANSKASDRIPIVINSNLMTRSTSLPYNTQGYNQVFPAGTDVDLFIC